MGSHEFLWFKQLSHEFMGSHEFLVSHITFALLICCLQATDWEETTKASFAEKLKEEMAHAGRNEKVKSKLHYYELVNLVSLDFASEGL